VEPKPSILCVDIGGTSTKAAVLDRDGEVRFLHSIPTAPDRDSYLKKLTELIARTRDLAGNGYGLQPRQMGVAIAGFLDSERKRFVYNSNLAWFEGLALHDHLSERFPELAIEIEVDSNAATMAEYQLGSGQGSERFLCITCGTGLGVGMAVDGVPLRFAYGCMGDIGHVIVLRDGPVCTCGGRGCAEIMISAPVLAEQYKTRTAAAEALTLRDVIEHAHAGDAIAISILESAGEWLGMAIASMANTFFPDHIAIAGGLSAGGDFVLKPAERVFRETASVLARSSATFTRATLGSMATLIGAAWPFWERKVEKSG
jgi:glucokinase